MSKREDYLRQHAKRLEHRIAVLERRNAELRSNIEWKTSGEQPPWSEWVETDTHVLGDGTVVRGMGPLRVFVNSRYQVTVFVDPADETMPEITHLSIKRLDGAAVHDWRDFQRIKNELVGREAEGVELYPAESRLVDGANQYHLFCMVGHRWPIGFRSRLVSDEQGDGVQQRPWAPEDRPADCVSISKEMAADVARRRLGVDD